MPPVSVLLPSVICDFCSEAYPQTVQAAWLQGDTMLRVSYTTNAVDVRGKPHHWPVEREGEAVKCLQNVDTHTVEEEFLTISPYDRGVERTRPVYGK
jgi:hypothetical protein